jgi:hypothetical protein
MTMPDISLCLWKDTCPLAPLCYRATATPSELGQSYFADGKPGEKCRYFMPNGRCVPARKITEEAK